VGQQKYKWFYLYGAIEPLKGQSVFWLMPDMRKESVKFFLERFRKEVEGKVALVWDQASGHRAMEGEILWGLIPSSCPHIVRS
jgi:transposase-like protein